MGKQAFLWKTEMLPGRQGVWLRDEEITMGASRKSLFVSLSAVMNDTPPHTHTFGGLTFISGSYHSPTWIGGVAVRVI